MVDHSPLSKFVIQDNCGVKAEGTWENTLTEQVKAQFQTGTLQAEVTRSLSGNSAVLCLIHGFYENLFTVVLEAPSVDKDCRNNEE